MEPGSSSISPKRLLHKSEPSSSAQGLLHMGEGKSKLIRVLVVDDHQIVRLGLRKLLGKNPAFEVVGEASTSADAIVQTLTHKPDVVLLDIRLPEDGGIDACREILDRSPKTRVLFLTSYSDDATVLAAFLAGAHGYLLKDIQAEALMRSLKVVAAGHSIFDPVVTHRIREWMERLGPLITVAEPQPLSPQENRILALVAEGKTNKEIAVALDLCDKTVKNYLANAFKKLRITRRSQAAAIFAKRHP